MTAAAERLNRFLARRGVASRRGVDLLIEAGRVEVNGRVAILGQTAVPGIDVVSVDGHDIAIAPVAATLMLHKPMGVITTAHDPGGRPTVFDLVHATPGLEIPCLVAIGRLDADSSGLILLTTDGNLAHRVSHPRFGVRKLYSVTLEAPPTAAMLTEITAGVVLHDGPARALQVRRITAVEPQVEIAMGEGRKREVRRLCAKVGMRVTALRRIAVGPVRLGRLADGDARRLTNRELSALYRAVELPLPDASARAGQARMERERMERARAVSARAVSARAVSARAGPT